jgi:8-oxo-dGTP pyrophosphatase MutT (NUDIX family)
MKIDVACIRRALRERPHAAAPLEGDERFAAVAAVLRERDGEAEVLLIRRAVDAKDPWSGHMAFPGGRRDPSDRDLLHTAVRETHEEVGLTLDPDEHLVGRLDDLPAVARGRRMPLVITPFVFAIGGDPVLVPRLDEVDETLWAPLGPLASGQCDTTYVYDFEGRKIHLPGYDVSGRVVWGLTHRMLGALFEALDGDPRHDYSRAP